MVGVLFGDGGLDEGFDVWKKVSGLWWVIRRSHSSGTALLTLVGLGYNVYRAVLLNQLFGALASAVEPRLGGLEEQLAGILAELDGEGVDVVQLLFGEGVCGHVDCYRANDGINVLCSRYSLKLQVTERTKTLPQM